MKKLYQVLNKRSCERSRRLTAVLTMLVLGALFSLVRPAEVKADDEFLVINVPDNGQVNASEIKAALDSSAQKDVRLIFDAGDTITLDMDQDLELKSITTRNGPASGQFCNLIIKGNKTLTIDTDGSNLLGASAIQDVYDLTVTSGNIIAYSKAGTVNVRNNFTMDGGSLTSTNTGSGGISGTIMGNSPGIFTMNGGSIKLISRVEVDKWATGITFFNKVTINGGSLSIDVVYSGTNQNYGAAGFMDCKNIEIKDGTVDVTADGSPSVGIYAEDKLSITGGKVSANAPTAAILVGKVDDEGEKELNIADGMVIVKPAEGGLGEANIELQSKPWDYKVIATKPGSTIPATEVEMIMASHSITVTDDGHGTGIATPAEATADTEITLSATPDDGYVFDKWTSEDDITFADSKNADTTFKLINKDVTVKANFKRVKRTITFNANGGDGVMDPQVADNGETVKINANEFTRSGYKFDGWNTNADGKGESYGDGASIKLEADISLYAQWIEDEPEPKPEPKPEPVKTFTVTVKTEGEGEATASLTSAESKKKITINATPKAGYKFKKWKATKGVEINNVSKASTSFTMPAKNVTVKAVFEKIYEEPQPEIKTVDDDKIIIAWWKVDEAKGYDIFLSRCNHDEKEIEPKLVKTIKGNKTFKWMATGLEPKTSYKAYVKAYTTNKNGKKKYISQSPCMHVYTSGGIKNYTNAKSIKLDTSDGKIKKNKLKLNVKDTYKIKASVNKTDKKRKLMADSHVRKLRYRSSDPGIARVNSKGKITAKRKGKCKIYVYAHNGVNKTISVTVK